MGRILQNGGNRKTLHSLCAPIGGNLRRMASPQFLRITLEEGLIELLSEMIHIEILKVVLFLLKNRTLEITETCLRRLTKAQILNRIAVKLYRIIKEFLVKIDA